VKGLSSLPSHLTMRKPVRRSLHRVLHIVSTFEPAREEGDVMQAIFVHRLSKTF
jgi:hypothetical protein